MSWVTNNSLTTFQKFCINILKCGPIPHHVAFIMDGNRRYARKQQIDKSIGHSRGFDKLSNCLEWCLELGISEVTVYAFSIENFKRSKEEVDALMQLAKEKFEKLLEEKDKLNEHGVCIRIIGNFDYLPKDIKTLFAKAMLLTKDNNKAILNVAFSYTSRDEISNSIQLIVTAFEKEEILLDDINDDLLSQCLFTNFSPNPDLLIRTSGEVRVSDFLLWQASNTQVIFAKVLWPEFSVWHLLSCIFKYQRNFYSMMEFDKQMNKVQNDHNRSKRVKQFVKNLNESRSKYLESFANL